MVTRETLTGAEIPTLGRISTLPSIRGWLFGDVSGSDNYPSFSESRGYIASSGNQGHQGDQDRGGVEVINVGAYHGGRDAGVSDEKIAICRA
jgi:hypothetical protein